MATRTKNYNLFKPDLTDPADITAMNGNWDSIDTQLKTLNDTRPTVIYSATEPTPVSNTIWLKPIE